MRLLFFFVFSILITSCVKNVREINYKPSQASVIANEIQKKVIFQLKVNKDLYPCEFGGGAKTPIRLLHCGFRYYNDIGIEKSIELLLFAVNQFLKEINSNEKIRPYLAFYPFKPENIEIRIFLYNQDGSKLAPEKLHVITMINGILEYMINGGADQLLPTIYKETYDEAMQKIATSSTRQSKDIL